MGPRMGLRRANAGLRVDIELACCPTCMFSTCHLSHTLRTTVKRLAMLATARLNTTGHSGPSYRRAGPRNSHVREESDTSRRRNVI